MTLSERYKTKISYLKDTKDLYLQSWSIPFTPWIKWGPWERGMMKQKKGPIESYLLIKRGKENISNAIMDLKIGHEEKDGLRCTVQDETKIKGAYWVKSFLVQLLYLVFYKLLCTFILMSWASGRGISTLSLLSLISICLLIFSNK